MDWADPLRLPPSRLGLPGHGHADVFDHPYMAQVQKLGGQAAVQGASLGAAQGDLSHVASQARNKEAARASRMSQVVEWWNDGHGLPASRAPAPQSMGQMSHMHRIVASQSGVSYTHDETMPWQEGYGSSQAVRPAQTQVCEHCWGTNGRHRRKCPAFFIAHETPEERTKRLRREERLRDQELGAEYVDADKQAEKTFIEYVPPRLPNAQSHLPACLLACLQTLHDSWGAGPWCCWSLAATMMMGEGSPPHVRATSRSAPYARLVSIASTQIEGYESPQGASRSRDRDVGLELHPASTDHVQDKDPKEHD